MWTWWPSDKCFRFASGRSWVRILLGIEKIFRPLVHLAHSRRALGWVKVDRVALVTESDAKYPRKHMTFMRRINVDATSWRCMDVDTTLFQRCVPAGMHGGWPKKARFYKRMHIRHCLLVPRVSGSAQNLQTTTAGWVASSVDPDQTPQSGFTLFAQLICPNLG